MASTHNMDMGPEVCALPGCRRPRYECDGVKHSYCSRSHANEALDRGVQASLLLQRGPSNAVHGARSANSGRGPLSQSPARTTPDVIDMTGKTCQFPDCPRSVYIDQETGRAHDFCSRRHARAAASTGERPLKHARGSVACKLEGCETAVYRDPVTGVESEYCSNRHLVTGTALRAKECIREGCSSAAWVDEDTGDVLDYCGTRCASALQMHRLVGQGQCSLPGCVRSNMVHPQKQAELGYCCEDHRLRATQRSLVPNPEPFVDRTFRGGTTSATDFELSVLMNRHPEYLSRKEQFMEKWEKPTKGSVSIVRMFKIKIPDDVWKRTAAYRQGVSNVQRRFHGTSCSDACTFFVDLRGGPCGEPTCNVCNICTHGFKLEDNVGGTARRTRVNLRYGNGLYFSSVSGKANDYAAESEKTAKSGKTVRCMFMANVAVGRAFKTYEAGLDPDNNECPPPGYDSVIGERGPALNYDEVVVYKEEAALPTHLVVYALH